MQSIRTYAHCALLMVAVAWANPSVAAMIYHVNVDTTALTATTGYLDLQFNPGGGGATGAQVALSGWVSDAGLSAGAAYDGSVTGALPGSLTFLNGQALNALLQPLTYGSYIQFDLVFSGAYENQSAGVGTRFSLALLDSTYDSLLTTDTNGTVLQFELGDNGETVPMTFASDVSGGTPVSTVSAVPLPAALPLFLLGLMTLGASRVTRRRV